jgi:hypothetical protein
MITSSTYTSCRCLGNTRVCSGNMRALLHAITAKSFFILKACGPLRVTGHVTVNDPPPPEGGRVRSHGAHGNADSRFGREAGSRAIGQLAALEPSRAGRRSPKPCDTWQHRSPPAQGGGIWSRVTRGSIRALPSREAGSGAAGHVAVPGYTLFSLSWLEAYMRGTDSLVHCHCCGKPHTFLALWPTCHTHNFVTSFATLVAKDLLATL